MNSAVYRGWINQPDPDQQYYRINGTKCIVQDNGEDNVTLWFTEGETMSRRVPRTCVSRCYWVETNNGRGYEFREYGPV